MKVFFDTNVYVAEALLGRAAERMLAATRKGSWRIYISEYVGDELERVLSEALGFSRRFAVLSRKRVLRSATLVEPGTSRHAVPDDPHDSPILVAALAAGADPGPLDSLHDRAETRFREWMMARYSSLHSLGYLPKPVMVHQIPHFIGHLRSRAEESIGDKVALLVIDGLALDQWRRS